MQIRYLIKKLITSILMALLLLSVVFIVPSSGSTQKKVILFTVSGITIEDLPSYKTNNALGLMNSRPANSSQSGSYYLSLGAGARAEAGVFGGLGFNLHEKLPDSFFSGVKARDFTAQNTGKTLPGSSIINLAVNDATAASFKYHNNIVPGLLGETLKKAGLRTAVIGNADTGLEPHREATLITMDLKGQTAKGDVSAGLNKRDDRFPGSIRTDYSKMEVKVKEYIDKADFIVVECGDTARIDYQRPFMDINANRNQRIKAAEEAFAFIDKVTAGIDSKTLAIIASPKPQSDAILQKDYLTPIIFKGPEKGVLTSETTRREGIVTNLDIAPTILSYFNVEAPVEMAGGKISSLEKNDSPGYVKQRHNDAVTMRLIRTPFIITYSIMLLMAMVLGIATIRSNQLQKKPHLKKTASIEIFLLFILALPLSSLFQFLTAGGHLALSLLSVTVLALVVAVTAFTLFRKKPIAPLLFITSLTTAFIILDGFTGTNMAQYSFFGSDIIAGGRYYGIGNVYMGILIGSAVFSVAGFIDLKLFKNYRKLTTLAGAFILLFVGIVLGLPQAGANVGGMITGVAAALVFGYLVTAKQFSLRTVLSSLSVFFIVIAVILGLGLNGGIIKSHAANAIAVIGSKGFTAVGDIIFRKAKQNINGTFSFPGFLLVSMFWLAVALNAVMRGEKGIFGQFHDKYPVVVKSFLVLIWAAGIGFIFNDTGAVTAASIAGYLIIPLFFLSLDRNVQKMHNS